MRYVTDPHDIELSSVISAIRRDRESWRNWHCMKIDILAHGNIQHWNGLHSGINRILEIYLEGKHGTVMTGTPYKITVFCKDVLENLLDTMGRQIIDLVRADKNVAAFHRVYDLHEETDLFLRSMAPAAAPSGTQAHGHSQGCLPLQLPEVRETKSDGLGYIDGRKVLLVEDDAVTRWMVKMALRDTCRLSVAPDAGKALATYQNLKPDLVLLDINLPDRTGHDVMANIFKCDPAAHIVMFSSQDSFENIVDSMASGAKGFIAKPFSRERLVACVQNRT